MLKNNSRRWVANAALLQLHSRVPPYVYEHMCTDSTLRSRAFYHRRNRDVFTYYHHYWISNLWHNCPFKTFEWEIHTVKSVDIFGRKIFILTNKCRKVCVPNFFLTRIALMLIEVSLKKPFVLIKTLLLQLKTKAAVEHPKDITWMTLKAIAWRFNRHL